MLPRGDRDGHDGVQAETGQEQCRGREGANDEEREAQLPVVDATTVLIERTFAIGWSGSISRRAARTGAS